jgi:hypothetical protein
MLEPPAGNPFDNGIVPDAWSRPFVDVPSIHKDVSDLCRALLDEVRRHHKRRSILIHGSAGSGKTHVLARLRAAAAGDESPTLFSYVRLATNPNTIRRHLRSCLVRDLVRRDEAGVMFLESLLLESLARETGAPRDPATDHQQLEALRSDPNQWGERREAFDDMCLRLGLDYQLARACKLILLRRHRQEIIHWLRSGTLPDDVREQLGFDAPAAGKESAEPEQVASSVVRQLVTLVTDTCPLVICFDQLEALQIVPGDPSAFIAFGRLAADLYDHGTGILLISCVQTAALPQIKTAIPPGDFHRLAQHEKVLGSLTEEQARDLIRARLDASPTLKDDPHRLEDPLWPVGKDRLQRFLAEGDRTPRRLCTISRESLPGGFTGRQELSDFFTNLFEQRRERPAAEEGGDRSAHDTDFLHGLSLVLAARKRFAVTAPTDRTDVDLVISLPRRTLSISICNDEGNALTKRLKRITEMSPADQEERIVVRDSRRPIPHTSKKAWEYWQRLAATGARTETGLPRLRMLAPTPEATAAIAAIQSILSDARAGDLTARGELVQPEAVERWIREQWLEESVEQLLAEIEFGPAEAAAGQGVVHRQLRDAVLETLQRRHVMRIEGLAVAVGCSESDLRTVLAADTTAFGTLGTPTTLVYERIATAS